MIALTRNTTHDQRGVVSIFIVIFSAIFITIITVSFLAVMTHDQQQATQNNLSQSAYDSAMAGVEDGKRAIVKCEQNPTGPGCNLIGSGTVDCNMLAAIGINQPQTTTGNNSEYPLQQNEASNSLNQAYTCVTINSKPGDYKADLTLGNALVIPLQSDTAVNSMTFQWQAPVNGGGGGVAALPLAGTDLLKFSDWNSIRRYPAVMRLQIVRMAGTTQFSALDQSQVETVFLYPNQQILAGGPTTVDFATDKRRRTSNAPKPVGCDASTYICSAKLIDGGRTMSEVANNGQSLYLIMTPLYENASVTLSLPGNATFERLQAVVDSTGRADNSFRRVQARIDLIPHPVYPNAALTLSGPLCKNFVVTPTASGYANGAISPGCED